MEDEALKVMMLRGFVLSSQFLPLLWEEDGGAGFMW
jgi:hypothetical protein